MLIELAPNHKRSLTLTNPLMLSSAFATDARVGALVTLPLTLHARGGLGSRDFQREAPLPRVVEIPGGVLMCTGAANPGLERVLRDHRRVWSQSNVPITEVTLVIVALAAQAASDWATMAARLERVEGVGGIELQLNPALDAVDAIRATRAATELPILAKLDLDNAVEIAAECVAAGANTLVIGRAPRGLALVQGRAWYGRMYGAMVKPLAMKAFVEIRDLRLDAPLVACGGVHSADDAREFLSAGASAVEIDSAAWIDPACVTRIAAGLANRTQTNTDEHR